MKGKYKTIKWEDVKIGDDDQEYLVFYKKGVGINDTRSA